MRRLITPILITGVCSWVISLPSAVSASDPRLEKVLADWQKRQNAVHAIDYQVEGEFKVPKGAYTNMRVAIIPRKRKTDPLVVAPADDLSGSIGFKLLLDFENERYRLETKEQSFNFSSCNLVQETKTCAFDGKELRSILPRENNPTRKSSAPEMAIISGDMKNAAYLIDCLPIFLGHGRIHTPMEQIVPGQIRNKPDPSYLHIHGAGVHDGRMCLVLRTQTLQLSTISFEEYWVDPEKESSIVRYVSYSGKQLTTDQEIVMHYKHLSDGWFLSGWRWTRFNKGKVLNYQDIHVANMKINPMVSEADFRMEIRAGMVVEEVKNHPNSNPFEDPKGDVSVYRLEKDGKKTFISDPYQRLGDPYEMQSNEPKHRVANWVFLTIFSVMLIVCGILVRYRLSNKRKNSNSSQSNP